jgi:hypothetical protein
MKLPGWLLALSEEDLHFLKLFLLHSGSLKALAAEYQVSYPTIRSRLDRLIDKVRAVETPSSEEPFERLVLVLAEQGVLSSGTARTLVQAHKRAVKDAAERIARDSPAQSGPDLP